DSLLCLLFLFECYVSTCNLHSFPTRRSSDLGRKRVVPYSIQWLKRLRPALFRQDLMALFDLLQQQKIKPLIAERLPLVEARHAQELLGKGGVIGKIVLVPKGPILNQQ